MIPMFGSRDDAKRALALRRIRARACAAIAPAEDDSIVVNELSCTEPGCHPVETVVAWLRPGKEPRLIKIFKRAVDVTDDDLLAALTAATESR